MADLLPRALTVGLVFVLCAQGALANEAKRCGWYANPTPGNHWLTDRDATWTLSVQGGAAAPGWLDLPPEAFAFDGRWVAVNGSYGYGCACVTGTFGPASKGKVIRVTALTPLPLARCEADPALPGATG